MKPDITNENRVEKLPEAELPIPTPRLQEEKLRKPAPGPESEQEQPKPQGDPKYEEPEEDEEDSKENQSNPKKLQNHENSGFFRYSQELPLVMETTNFLLNVLWKIVGEYCEPDPWNELSKDDQESRIRSGNLGWLDFTGVDVKAIITRAQASGHTHFSFTRSILQGVDLSGLYMSGYNFTSADLSGANLTGSNLKDAHFEYAWMEGVSLFSAHCKNTIFARADMRGADLSKVDLSESELTGANITHRYELCLMLPGTKPKPHTLYLSNVGGKIAYTVIPPQGGEAIREALTSIPAPSEFILAQLLPLKQKILKITLKAGHIQENIKLRLGTTYNWDQFSTRGFTVEDVLRGHYLNKYCEEEQKVSIFEPKYQQLAIECLTKPNSNRQRARVEAKNILKKIKKCIAAWPKEKQAKYNILYEDRFFYCLQRMAEILNCDVNGEEFLSRLVGSLPRLRPLKDDFPFDEQKSVHRAIGFTINDYQLFQKNDFTLKELLQKHYLNQYCNQEDKQGFFGFFQPKHKKLALACLAEPNANPERARAEAKDILQDLKNCIAPWLKRQPSKSRSDAAYHEDRFFFCLNKMAEIWKCDLNSQKFNDHLIDALPRLRPLKEERERELGRTLSF